MRKHWIWIAPLAILGLTLFIIIGGVVVQWLWNALLPPLFGLPDIGFWQALGLLALSRILFGGVRLNGGGGDSRGRAKMADRIADRVADRMAERWDAMTPEEREQVRERMRSRWGLGATGSCKTD